MGFVSLVREPTMFQESYFERMWCSYELAVHAKTCGKNLHLVPLWMPLWTLLWLAADTVVGAGLNPLVSEKPF